MTHLACWLLGLLAFFPPMCLSKDTTCKGLPCWYAYYNKLYFGDKLPKDADVDYGVCPDLTNVIACSWRDTDKHGRTKAYIRLIKDYNLAANQAHLSLQHEMCHLANPHDDHGAGWIGCMHALANSGAMDSLW